MPIRFQESQHPLVKHKISYLKQEPEITNSRDFEHLIKEITMLLTYEATENLKLTNLPDQTPQGTPLKAGYEIEKMPILIPVVRHGLVMFDIMRSIISAPYTGHIGIYDDPESGEPKTFMATLPDDVLHHPVIILDLAIHRGKTARHAMREIRLRSGTNIDDISFVSLIASESGLNEISQDDLLSGRPKGEGVRIFSGMKVDDLSAQNDFPRFNERLFRTSNRKMNEIQ
jgi:uracil phosphoribosyltransferase